MKYTQIQRRTTENFITIGEYIQETEPNTYVKLNLIPVNTAVVRVWSKMKDVSERILAAADVSGADKHYRSVMQERPHPGRGGLLPGEGDENL